MNEPQIETLLRQGAVLKAPTGLLDDLIADIRLPRPTARAEWLAPAVSAPWFKRWLPALSFAVLFLGCLVAIAMQTDVLSGLKKQNDDLRAAAVPLDDLRRQNQEYQRLQRENAELGRLRKDNAELLKLRGEVAQLAAQPQSLETLHAQNQQLQSALAALAASTNAQDADFFAEAKARAERIQCVNNLKQLGLAGRVWAQDNNGVEPPDFISMTNEMGSWKILQCPTDKSHTVQSWADVAAGNISYQMLTPGIKDTEDPRTVFIECPIHHNACLLDGSVQMLNPETYQKYIKVVNGRKIFE